MKAERETSFLTDLNRNIRIVHRVCRTYFYRDAVEREDVFQDIMYQLWKSYPQFKGESKLSTWIYKVALNTAITHVRRDTRRPQSVELRESIPHSSDIYDDVSRNEEVHLLYDAIDTLTAVDKAIILLHLEDQSDDEIASNHRTEQSQCQCAVEGRAETGHKGRGKKPEFVPVPEAGPRFRDHAADRAD